MKLFKILFPTCWLLAFLAIGSFYFWGADHEETYYEEENRNLAGLPDLAEAIAAGTLDSDIENFLLDHFPMRQAVIENSDTLRNTFSIAGYEDYVKIASGSTDPLDSGNAADSIQDILNGLNGKDDASKQTGSANDANSGAAGQGSSNSDGAGHGDSNSDGSGHGDSQSDSNAESNNANRDETVSGEESGVSDESGTQTSIEAESQTLEETEPQENPPIVPKEEADPEDYAETLYNYMEVDGVRTEFGNYSRDSVLAFTSVLNQYAAALPENGKLLFTMVPQATYANLFVNSTHNGSMKQEAIDVIQAFSSDNVYAFDAAAILSEPIANDEYIFFRTDMHWTPYGSYLLYSQMASQAGKIPADYETGYSHQTEAPFLGTYYRDNPSDYMKDNPDTLELLEPIADHELRRITGKDTYNVIPYLDFNAKSNDRYTVYLGGPAGPWTYVETDNDEEENALVIMDSFGLGYFTYLTANYKQVHYYDPRYFDYYQVGYSVSEMIEKYDITDIYVVIGDLHSFSSDFILTYANKQFSVPE